MKHELSALIADYRAGKVTDSEVGDLLRRLKAGARTYELSEGQRGLWALQKAYPGMAAYNVPLCFRVSGLDGTVFERACRAVVRRHPVLTTVLGRDGDRPVQSVDPGRGLDFARVDLGALPEAGALAAVEAEHKRPFAMEGEPLLRIRVFARPADTSLVLVSVHHIVFDGSSARLLAQELFDTYETLLAGGEPRPARAGADFEAFVREERATLPGRRERLLDHWRERLAGPTAALNLPTDRPHDEVVDRFAGETAFSALPGELARAVGELAATRRTFVSTVMLAAYAVLLAGHSDEREVVVGMPVNERDGDALADAMGLMINMMPVRVDLAGSATFGQLAAQVQREVADGMLHGYPFAALARELGPTGPSGRSPLFQTAFVFQDVLDGFTGPDRPYELVRELHQEGEYELSVEVWGDGDGYALHWKYHPELFGADFVAALGERYRRVLEAVTADPGIRLDDLRALVTADADAPCVHDLFDAAAARTPYAVAVTGTDEILTYDELRRRSDALAAHLVARGVRPNDLVTVFLDRSAAMVVALLGILKAGAAYVPLDPELPAARLADIVADSGTSLIVTQARLGERARALLDARPAGARAAAPGALVVLDEQRDELAAAAARGERPEVRVGESELAYVIYTSGSTGKPKGVMIQHRGFTNLLRSMAAEPGLGRTDTLFAVTTVSFDMAQVELFLPLVTGGRCYVCDSATLKDVGRLKERIGQVRPTVMQATPATWSMLFHSGWRNTEGLRIFTGGEALSRTLKDHFLSTGTEAWNLYGPTETTVYSTGTLVRADAPITIGRPLANTEVLILDERLRPVAEGEPGELCIAGAGLAKGYVNRPELTAEKFVAHPLVAGARLYRTGDLARWNEDGEIDYLGRLDFQVKIRGNRVELGDIEYHFGRHEAVAECVVVARGEDAAKQLVAYYRQVPGRAAGTAGFKEYLRERLPSYMVPDFYVPIDDIPLTGSGKVDRNALARREISLAPAPAAAPAAPGQPPALAEIEAQVLACWQDVLQVRDIGPTASFFEVGGNSLAAVVLAERVAARFGVPFAAADLFKYATARAIAAHVREHTAPAAPAGEESTAAGEGSTAVVPAAAAELPDDAVAIVGIACRFGDAEDHWRFWEDLRRGDGTTRFWTEEELRAAGVPERVLREPGFVPLRSALPGKDVFDGEFFRLSPNHVALMDPQFRQLLLHAWKAVEDAGHDHRDIPATGVYVTSGNHFYGAPDPGAAPVIEDPQQYLSWVMAQSGTVASMISYQLGFGGPSLAVHSNCSSSLSALSLAARAVRGGETDFALVAAASAARADGLGYVHKPGLNFSGDGRVKAFDADADGMVGGEGVAALLIRRAEDAVADGDHIYGLLRSVATSSDGAQATGFYSPSVDGQSRAVRRALESAGVDARSIGYVEAHGTGTKLGDPVELAALTEAYREHTDATGYCGIGSVKSNLGHLDSAAGLAGTVKVLLSLYHGELAPTLNYSRPNPQLKLERTPFHVVDRLRAWPRGEEPRRAAQSSIGLGGSNAHAVFEEYAADAPAPDDRTPQLVPLSARTRDNLAAYARELRAAVASPRPALRLRDVAHTFQVGRVAMAHRVAFVVRDLDELAQELTLFLDGRDSARRFGGEVPRGGAPTGPGAAKVDRWLANGAEKSKLKKLAQAWARGADVEWRRLAKSVAGRRTSLPTYPFSPVVHPWPTRTAGSAGPAPAHPLLHENVSGLGAVRHRTRFTGEEFVLRDHVVDGKRLLPAVASLEMAYTAVRRALPAAGPRVTLRNVSWVRPVAVGDGGRTVEFTLTEDGAPGAPRFELTGSAEDGGQLHVQGRATAAPGAERPAVDLARLRAALRLRPLSGEECYAYIARAGVVYGPGFRLVRTLHRGAPDGRRETLAELRLPGGAALEPYALHPGFLDAAIHASLGLDPRFDTEAGAASRPREASATPVPFALDRLDVFAPCEREMYAWVRPAPGERAEGAGQVLDIDLTDARGRVCAALRGLAYRALDGRTAGAPGGAAGDGRVSALRTLLPVWQPKGTELAASVGELTGVRPDEVFVFDADRRLSGELGSLAPGHRTVELPAGASVAEIAELIRATGRTPAHLVWVAPHEGPDPVADQERGAVEVYRLLRALLSLGLGTKPLTWTALTFATQRAVPGDPVAAAHAGVHGLLGSAAKEHGRWTVRLLDLPATAPGEALRAAGLALPAVPAGTTLALREGRWLAQELRPVAPLAPATAPYRDGGRYVVVGGAGGIGALWSRHLVEHHRAAIVWIGRRPLEGAVATALADLAARARAVGAEEPLYVRADASDEAALAAAYRTVKRRHDRIDGVVHSAIVLADKTLANMDEDRFRAALSAKVDVGVHLARVFGAEPLDFVLFFSSVESFVRDAGQANYAAGCTFKDALALDLADRWPTAPGAARPVVKSVNWGYWGVAGVVSDDFYRTRMAAAGIDSLEPEEALRTLGDFLGGAHGQVALMRTFDEAALRALVPDEHVAAAGAVSVLGEVVAAHRAPHGEVARLGRFLPHPRLCELAERLLFTTLRDLGLDGLEERIPAKYGRWLAESDRVLSAAGLVEVRGGRRALPAAHGLDPAELWRQWHAERAAWTPNANQRAQVDLVESCLLALREVLTGERPATEILFPGSSMSRVEGIYRGDPIADYFNDRLGELLVDAVRRRRAAEPGRPLRILEVGAGTGATSAKVLAALEPLGDAIAEYCYTDLSKAFLFRAEEQLLPRHPYLTTRIFNAEKPPLEQGIEPGGFDLVVATNVLHATADIAATLRNVRAAMRPGGLLFMNEMSRNTLLAHLTFGLVDGWWLYRDADLRIPGSPVLTPESWVRVLRAAGFAEVGQPDTGAHALGQQLTVAANAGGPAARTDGPSAQAPAAPRAHALAAPRPAVTATVPDADLRARTLAYFEQLLRDALRLTDDQLDSGRNLHDYGLDSILVSGMNNTVARDFEDVPSTLFFELRTLDELTDHFVETRRPELLRLFGTEAAAAPTPPLEAPSPLLEAPTALLERAVAYVTELVAATLRMAPGDLAPDADLFDLGLDSILVIQLNNALGRDFDELSSTLFFDCPTVREVAGHFTAAQPARLAQVLGAEQPPRTAEPVAAPVPVPDAAPAAVPTAVPAAGSDTAEAPAEAPLHAPAPVAVGTPAPRLRDIAVVGLAGRYPGAADPAALWENVRQGRDCTTAYPEDRWWLRWEEDGKERPKGGFLADVASFDAEYFGITDAEAAAMDPQERLFVETVHSALQDAGYTAAALNRQGRVGVFAGAMNATYNGRTAHSSIANRTSFLFDFQGPSIALDTACSSSLTAIHLALESLYSGDNDCAVAGGVNLLLDADHFEVLAEHGLLSAGDRCRPFAEHADGFLAAEGVGAVVLRPLEDALASGDHVYAVIKGSAVNAGGRTSRYSMPSLTAQRDVVARALEKSGVEPATVSYVEAHGTATALGDSIEISALSRAFGTGRAGQYCAVGSLKSNLGHAESASGVAGLTKVLMQLRHRQLAPSIHAEELNAGIVFQRTPFAVQRSLAPWAPVDADGRPLPRRAGISCFGAGGSNAHLIVEEHPGGGDVAPEPARLTDEPRLVPLSARTPEQLRETAGRLVDFVADAARAGRPVPLSDLAYTLQVGRDELPVRLALVVRSVPELAARLAAFLDEGRAPAAEYADLTGRDTGRAAPEPVADPGGAARRWLTGAALVWEALYGGARMPRRMSLPTYPFAKTTHWYGRTPAEAVRTATAPAPAPAAVNGGGGVRALLRDAVAAQLAVDPDDVRTDADFLALGLTSMGLVRLAKEIQRELDPAFESSLLFEYATVDELAAHLGAAPERHAPGHPLSEGQQGLWTLQKAAPESAAYNVPLCFRTTGLDIGALRAAFAGVRARHQVLGAAVEVAGGSLLLAQRQPPRQLVTEHQLSAADESGVVALIRAHAKRPFDLDHGPLCRLDVFHGPDGTSWVLLNAHHLVLDGASAVLLVKELLARYTALTGGRTPDPARPSAPYGEFVAAEARALGDTGADGRLAYWRERLAQPLPAVALPADRPRPTGSGVGATATRRLTPELGARLAEFARGRRVYASAVHLAAFTVLLRQYTQQDDVIVGMPVSTRPARGFERTVGHFVDMLPVRTRVTGGARFADLCKDVQKNLADGLAHHHPFPALVRELGLSAGEGGAPVFRYAFMYQDWYEDVTADAPAFSYVEGIHQEGEYELVLEVVEPAGPDGAWTVNCKYDTALFDAATAEQLLRQYAHLLETVPAEPEQLVDACSLLSPEERHTLTVEWNATGTAHPDRPVHELFAERAARTPDAPAVVAGPRTLTYAELDERSGRLAAHLADLGVGPGSMVAVHLERSPELLTALLATAKAGGAYIPLDPDYPQDRLAHILRDARPQVVLTHSTLQARLPELAQVPSTVLMDRPWPGGAPPRARATADDLAYVIYTSGSTGDPKGVMVPHGALTNFLCSMADRPGLRAADRLLAVTTHSFDIAALELYLPLVVGACVHLCDADTARDPGRLKDLLGAVRPTVMQATPSTWTMLLHAGWTNAEGVRVLCGGEALPETLRERLTALGCEAWNLFGPTETTIWSTAGRIEADGRITIGTPIDNTQVYILDGAGRPAPAGVPGELCIAGAGLAKGYLNKPELTAERFPENPFTPGTRLYRTGDLARWLSDGRIECLGRIDSQVKIRGFRVELGEIEHVLSAHPGVRECVVVARTHADNRQLVAYYVPAADPVATGELTGHLARKVPAYMVPSFVLPVETLPRTPNGKIDRKNLEERPVVLDRTRTPRPAEAPETGAPLPDEADVLALWREVLGVDGLAATDAFLDAGGSSVLAAVLADRAAKRYGMAFTAAETFKCVNARGMSAHLRAGAAPARPQAPAERPVPAAADLAGSVAVIGISCRLPGAEDHHAFWRNLLAGEESVELCSADELRELGVDEQLIGHPDYVPVRASMRGKGLFDADFFHVSPRDAELMDPQLRLLLQHSWKAVEDAGRLPGDITDSAVYVSTSNALYQAPLASANARRDSESLVSFLQAQPGTIPTTVSHKLGLTGPSLYVHSNCSSSLAGLTLAVQAIQSGQTRHALVGGAGMYAENTVGHLFEEGMTLSSDGHCKPFDAEASGMIGGEGVVVVLLKDAESAVRDGDHVYALLRGAGMNNDGDRKAGYHAPSVSGQAELVSTVLDRAGVHPETIGYLEAHGTGTRLGDPIEVMAVSEAYRRHTDRTGFCGIGSVKSNLGHLDAAAGLAGLVKTALVVGERRIPPTVNHRVPNPQIDFAGSPFYVVDRLVEHAPSAEPMRAAVSSFGIGGTNVHAVLEEPPARGAEDAVLAGPHLVPLSARAPRNLRRYADDLAHRLTELEETGRSARRLADVAFTLQVGRTQQPERVAFVVRDVPELIGALREFAAGADRRVFGDGGDALARTAEQWVRGGEVEWPRADGAHPARRISLPTYPFTEEYFWLRGEEAAGSAGAAAVRAETPHPRRDDPSDLEFFEERWVATAAQPVPDAPASEARVVLCFLDGSAERAAYERSLRERAPGAEVVFVGAGTPYPVDRDDERGWKRALGAVAAEYGRLDAIHYLWPTGHPGAGPDGQPPLLRELRDVALLVRAVAAARLEVPHLLVAGHFRDAVERAALDALIGYERSLTQVLPGTALRVVLHEGPIGAAQWAALLRVEQGQDDRASALYRADGVRHTCRVERVDAPARPARSVLRQGGSYLLTGAFGGLGRRLAEYLAREYRAHLILLGRSEIGAADEAWADTLRRTGGRVVCRRADVSDPHALAALRAELPEELRALDGVLHLAGAAEPVALPDKSVASIDAVLGAKAHGTLALERVLGSQHLDFVCHFSSVAAVLGDFGSGDYAVANRFQAAYARALGERPPHGHRTLAVQWPLWREGGMGASAQRAADLRFMDAHLRAAGRPALETAAGLDAFERLLAAGPAAPMVLRAATATPGAPARPAARPEPAAPAKAPKTGELAYAVREVVQHVLKAEARRIDDRSNFVDLGFDSIRLTQLAHRLSDRVGVRLLPTVLYDHPSIERLVEHLAGEDVRMADAAGAAETGVPVTVSEPAVPAESAVVAEPAAAVERLAVAEPAVGDEPVAIIGMSGIFPGCRSVAEFWDALAEGKDMVRELPPVRFGEPTAVEPDGERYRWMGSVDWADEFDAAFFEIAPKEARTIDPRQRHLLQESWRALEDAALGAEELKGRRVGVFVGVEQGDYQFLVQDGGNVTSNHDGVLAARLSYFLDLKGPVLAVNTSCSSGLVALHQACLSLRQGECDIAVVAAANFVLTPRSLEAMSRAGMLSETGRCRTFDQRADGMVPGEAVTALVLRPLAAAEANGDPVHSVIAASGLNYDGRTNGITAPAGESQRELLSSVYERGGIDPSDLGHIVTHGTGTKLGDPVEVNALRTAFRTDAGVTGRGFCALTSTKTNFGHTFAASGLVGLMSLSESVRRGVIPASLHCERDNEYIDWNDSPFYVNRTTKAWTTPTGAPRTGAVSAFGMSGTNAHVVVREYVPAAGASAAPSGAAGWLLPLSAKTEAALAQLVDQLLDRIADGGLSDADLPALARTLGAGRHHFRHRCAVVAGTLDEAAVLWRGWRDGSAGTGCFAGTVARDFSARSADGADTDEMTAPGADLDTAGRRRALFALAERYVRGHDLPSTSADAESGGRRPARLRLPTYPFARNRYWVRAQTQVAPEESAATEKSAAGGKPAAEVRPAGHAPAAPVARGARPAPAESAAPVKPVVLADPAAFPHRLAEPAPARGRTRERTVALTPLPAPARPVTREHDILEDLKSAANLDFGGMVATLNRTGVMVEHLIPYSSEFAEYAGECGGEVLDLGCAYGIASIAALERGARVVALDMEKKHLEILEQRVNDDARTRLTLRQGVLPDVDFEDGRFTAVHASRVMHFLTPEGVGVTLRKMFRWLEPGGKVFLSTDSPYFGYWASKAADYEARRLAGDPWPGYIADVAAHFEAAHVVGGPSLINALDPEVFRRECEAAGFVVERAGYFGAVGVDRGSYGAPGPDMEHVGIIARKPEAAGAAGSGDTAGAGIRRRGAAPAPAAAAGPRDETGRVGDVQYRVRGTGTTALVLIHGLGCDMTYWERQAEYFADRYTVVTPDLAGHGGSGRERRHWTVEAYARDVADVVARVGAEDVVLVGHSLGGPVMLAAEPLLGGRVRGMVGVDTLHTFDPQPLSARQLDRFVRSFADAPVRAEELFLDTGGADLVALVERTRAQVGEAIVSASFREMLRYLQRLPKRFGAPVTLVNSTSWMPTDTASAAKYGVDVEFVDGVGHFVMLEAPEVLNASLERLVKGFLDGPVVSEVTER
ncbi:amino acid adenylation domain-containing protein [Streptomyces sp. NPDC059070]|uniref:amino acid adenylation domain-containing protein n=1 Tax=Streptomyces sp. NPDC059070 TaxID=3346713 RepID=UPI00369DB718